MSRLFALVCLVAGAGCSSSKYAPADSGFADTAAGEGEGEDTADLDDEGVSPMWWKLGAAIGIYDGVADPASTHLALTLVAEDGTELCEDTLAVDAIEDVPLLPDSAIYAWWEIEPGDADGGCEHRSSPVPSPLYLGVGAMHPDIEANLDPAGLHGLEGYLNASYASLDDGDTIYVYGVAGSEQAWLGIDEAISAGPLADGTWIISPIYPFAY